jgi:hypothetical protein
VVAATAVAGVPGATSGAGAAGTTSAALAVLGHTDLGGKGVNGDVAVAGTTAIVGAGLVPDTGYHTAQFSPFPCLTVTAKVVDLSDPKKPRVASTIPIPTGVAAIDVDALKVKTPSFDGVLAAIALDDGPSESGQTACTANAQNPAPTFVDRGVVYYDITHPDRPRMLGRYMADQGPSDDVAQNALPCGPPPDGAAVRCATGQHSVSLAQRNDGRVLSITVEPTADLLVRPSGDVRIEDVTDPAHPVQLSAWPELGQRPASFSSNGCAPYTNGHSAAFYADGRRALVAFMDGGLFDLDVGSAQLPRKASQYAYPADRTEEGNAGFATATDVGGQTVALLSEEGWTPAATSVKVDSPPNLAGTKFACEGLAPLFDPAGKAQLYSQPNGSVAGQLAYVGRGCPARGNAATPVAEDPYLSDPRGKIALIDTATVVGIQPDNARQVCNSAVKVKRAQDAGAIGVLFARVQLPPLAASPDATAWSGDPSGLTIPSAMVDTGVGDAFRTALCPPPVNGQCAAGQPVNVTMSDAGGTWGGLRILDVDPDTGMSQVALIHSVHGMTFPPPDLGVYAPGPSVADGKLAYVAWHADGVRVIDLSAAPPREVAHFVPKDAPDPAGALPPKASVVGVALAGDHLVAVDQNSGLYVLSRPGTGRGSTLLVAGAVLAGAVVLVGAVTLVRRRLAHSRPGS